jgi:hypothetical protein
MTGNCSEVRNLFGKMLDEELTEEERKHMREHLARCSACSSLLEEELQIKRTIESLPEAVCPERVKRNIYAATIQRDTLSRQHCIPLFFRSHTGLKAAAFGALAVVLFLLILGYPPQNYRNDPEGHYHQEILKARKLARWSYVYAAQVIENKNQAAVSHVLDEELCQRVRDSIRNKIPFFNGG